MSPSVAIQPAESYLPVDVKSNGKVHSNGNAATENSSFPKPLRKTGALDSKFKFDEITPVIGREYPTANIVDDLLNGQNGDELLRDLAITSKSDPRHSSLRPADPSSTSNLVLT